MKKDRIVFRDNSRNTHSICHRKRFFEVGFNNMYGKNPSVVSTAARTGSRMMILLQ